MANKRDYTKLARKLTTGKVKDHSLNLPNLDPLEVDAVFSEIDELMGPAILPPGHGKRGKSGPRLPGDKVGCER